MFDVVIACGFCSVSINIVGIVVYDNSYVISPKIFGYINPNYDGKSQYPKLKDRTTPHVTYPRLDLD
jgi:hypothetical protein